MRRDLWVEFNDLDASGELTSHVDFAREGVELRTGTTISVGDDEGNICRATVVEIGEDGRVRLALDLDTFEASPPVDPLREASAS